ncbi:hypothetical protein [Lentzea jiangxiensis]|uniref:Uncharacterized protein n=1 Tax=Lentzea jiangxiensis TaxID=641025 RepID=A0A1H0X688_9PSEU|nr:hypothetical protein [Lentzea jiangxiensis]SDP98255.1 hypothetical protein SAMN05421507_13718 [Lentzea jiangxiensis]
MVAGWAWPVYLSLARGQKVAKRAEVRGAAVVPHLHHVLPGHAAGATD